MPTHFTHKHCYIAVRIIRRDSSSDIKYFKPKVEVGSESGNLLVNIATSQAFADEKTAEACGFDLGREWIDRSSQYSNQK